MQAPAFQRLWPVRQCGGRYGRSRRSPVFFRRARSRCTAFCSIGPDASRRWPDRYAAPPRASARESSPPPSWSRRPVCYAPQSPSSVRNPHRYYPSRPRRGRSRGAFPQRPPGQWPAASPWWPTGRSVRQTVRAALRVPRADKTSAPPHGRVRAAPAPRRLRCRP